MSSKTLLAWSISRRLGKYLGSDPLEKAITQEAKGQGNAPTEPPLKKQPRSMFRRSHRPWTGFDRVQLSKIEIGVFLHQFPRNLDVVVGQ